MDPTVYNPGLKRSEIPLLDIGNTPATSETVKNGKLPMLPLKKANCNVYGNG